MSGISNSLYLTSKYAIEIQTNAIAVLQEQSVTGDLVNRVSDDPLSGYRLLNLESQNNTLTDQIDILTEITSSLEISSSIVEELYSTMADVSTDLSQIISGTYGETSREELANQIEESLKQVLSLANTQYQDDYIFGGSDTSSVPYVVEYNDDGKISSVTYQGSTQDREVQVSSGVSSSAYYVGTELFECDNRDGIELTGNTGVAAGTGTSNIDGDAWLTVTATTGGYNLSIDGGTTNVFTDGTDTNLAVYDADGNVMYVDTTGITDEGTEYVEASGTFDIFNVLISLRDILSNEQNLDDEMLSDVRSQIGDSLSEVATMLTDAQVNIGSRIGFLSDVSESLENIQYNVEEEESVINTVDTAQLAIDLAYQEMLYQMTLSVAGNMLSTTLLDYL